jgi:hypothetical protein
VRLAIVFFDEPSTFLWGHSPFASLARRVLKAHLATLLTSHVTLLAYPSVRDVEFCERLLLLDPSWVLTADPTTPLMAPAHTKIYWSEHIRAFLFDYQRPVVLVPGLEFRGNDVWGWTLAVPRLAHKRVATQMPWFGLLDLPAYAPTSRSLSAAGAVHCALESSTASTQLRGIIAHAFELSQSVPLEARFVEDIEQPDASVLECIQSFCTALLPFASIAGLHDCVDGRLIHALWKSNGDYLRRSASSTTIVISEAIPVVAISSSDSSRKAIFRSTYHYHNGRPIQAKAVSFAQRHTAPVREANKATYRKNLTPEEQKARGLLSFKEREALEKMDKKFLYRQKLKQSQKAVSGSARQQQLLADSMIGPTVRKHVIETGAKETVKPKVVHKAPKQSGKAAKQKGGNKAAAIRAKREGEEDDTLKRNRDAWKQWRKDNSDVSVQKALLFLHEKRMHGGAFEVECLVELTLGAKPLQV